MSKDLLGNEVEVGDTIAYCTVGYSDLSIGKVINVTPKGATVGKKSNYSGKLNRSSSQFIVIKKGEDNE